MNNMALNQDKKQKLALEMEARRAQDCIELERARIDNRNKYQNLTRYMQIQRKQMQDADKLEKTKQEAALKEAHIKGEENLAQSMAKMKQEEMRDLCLRQQLRENDPELRELESKLRAAYVNKQLLTQLAEKRSEALEKKLTDKQACAVLEYARINQQEYNMMQREEELKRKTKYKQDLQDQMILQERSKRYVYEEFLREKKMIDDIIQRVHEEDERALQEKICRVQRTKEELIKFKEAQEIWKQKRKVALEEEDRRISEYLQEKAREQHLREMHKHVSDIRKAQQMEALARQMYLRQQRDKERQEAVEELKEEEYKAAVEERHKRDTEAELRRRLEVRVVLDMQLKEKEEKLRKEAEEDAAYQQQLLEKLAVDQRVDQMSMQKKRMKMLQLRRDVEDVMVQRRQKRAEEMQELIRMEEESKKQAAKRRQIVEEERLRMLKEHAKNLIGYIPAGVLREEDLVHLGSEVLEEYRSKE